MRRILVVPHNLLSMLSASFLDRRSFKVRSVADAGEALAVLGKWPPDLIIFSSGLAGLPVADFARMVRADKRSAATRLFMLSPEFAGEVADDIAEAEVDGHLVEPFTEADLLNSVGVLLDVSARRAPRLKCSLLATISDFTGPEDTMLANILGLSETGMLLECQSRLTIGDLIEVQFVIPESEARVSARCVVLKADELQLHYACEFFDVDDAKRQVVRDFVSAQLAQQRLEKLVRGALMDIIGIDFGTTNSVAALEHGTIPVRSEQGSPVLPSVAAFTPSGATLVGTAARRRRAIDAKNTIFSAKRLIGRGWHSPEAAEFRARYPFEMVETTDGELAFHTRAGTMTPIEVGAIIISKVIADAPIDIASARAAIAIPSGYGREHREATIAAATSAGLHDVMLVNEPIATAAAYLAPGEELLRHAAVYDLGGGTFDFAIVDCVKPPYRVLAHGGDLYLGGDDIDQALASWAADRVRELHRWDLRADEVVFDRLVVECERAKRRLCLARATTIELAQVDPAAPAATSRIAIGRDVLAQLSLDLVRRTFVICDAVLSEAGVRAANLDGVFLAGGTTQLPMVRTAVTQYFSRTPRSPHDPMEVVGLGTAIARALAG